MAASVNWGPFEGRGPDVAFRKEAQSWDPKIVLFGRFRVKSIL